MLSVTGMFAYNLLFEARARYLYVYAPLYIILAAVGIETILKRFRPVKEKRGKRKTIQILPLTAIEPEVILPPNRRLFGTGLF
jgi:hypothetical protein